MEDQSELIRINKFIDSIANYKDEEICQKYNYISNYLKNKHLDDKCELFKFLAIKTIRNLDIKAKLIKKEYFFNGISAKRCHSWILVMSVLDNLREEDKIIVLGKLILDEPFKKVTEPLNIPNNLRFGVELEYYNISFLEIKEMIKYNSMNIILKTLQIPEEIIDKIIKNSAFEVKDEFNKWVFSKECFDHAPEASSPIMLNTTDCLNQIKAIDLLFKSLGSELNGGTGLHINVGADYFNGKIEALKYLLKIWGECEELFFKIANQEQEEMRIAAEEMALPIKEYIQKTFATEPNFHLDNQEDVDKFLYNIQVRNRLSDLLSSVDGDYQYELYRAENEEERYSVFKKSMDAEKIGGTKIRFTSINFNHLTWKNNIDGRIEFRLFNNSFNYNTIAQNILLVGKLFETSLALANNDKIKRQAFRELLRRRITEEEKLNLLLDLLFDKEEEKEIFRRRWESVKDNPIYDRFYSGKRTFLLNKSRQYRKVK